MIGIDAPAPRTSSGLMMVSADAPAAAPVDFFRNDLRETSLESSMTCPAVEKIVSYRDGVVIGLGAWPGSAGQVLWGFGGGNLIRAGKFCVQQGPGRQR